MARLPRLVLPGVPHHLITRGNNRQVIFCADEDYQFYLDKLFDACYLHHCAVHAYVLMTNHVHLLITPEYEEGLSKLMQSVGRYYVQYFNHCYRRTGSLWEGRFKSAPVDSTHYLFSCMRYIEMNPVRADMVQRPSDYRWSSYHSNALGKNNEGISPHALYRALGNTGEARQKRYRSLFKASLSKKEIEEIRGNTETSWVIGDERFKDEIAKLTERAVAPRPKGGDRKSAEYKGI